MARKEESSIVGIVVTTAALLSVFPALRFVDAGASRIMVSAERDVDTREELVHPCSQIKRPCGITLNSSISFKHQKRIRYNVNELNVMIYHESRFLIGFHRSTNGLGSLHSCACIQVC